MLKKKEDEKKLIIGFRDKKETKKVIQLFR